MIKPLTRRMLEVLIDCHEREVQSRPPLTAESTKQLRGLYQRGLVQTKLYHTEKNKNVIGFYITDEGKRLLDEIR